LRAASRELNAWQVIVLMFINMNEAVSGNIIWPFLPFLVGRSANDEDVGFYVGLLASSFFLGQTLFVGMWGACADRWGRRPILLVGLMGSALSMAWFGFARSYWEALAARFFCGILNGNIAVRGSLGATPSLLLPYSHTFPSPPSADRSPSATWVRSPRVRRGRAALRGCL